MKIWLDGTPAIHGERAVRRNTRNLLSALIRRSVIDYGLIYFDWKGNTPGRIALDDLKNSAEKICRFPMTALVPLWKRLQEPTLERFVGKVDLLYAPDLYFPAVDNGLILSTIRGIAFLTHKQMINPNQSKSLLKAFSYAKSFSDYFLAVSESTRQDILEYTDISEDRLFVVTHGVDPSFKVMPRNLAKKAVCNRFQLEQPYIIYVGALSFNKNILGLIEAFSIVAFEEKNIHLVVVGPDDAASTDAIKSVTKKNLSKRVHFIGSVEQEGNALTELYNAAEMLVFPSFYEGWCAPPLESMACGTPVVCSNIASVREVVGDSAILIDPEDSESIANAITNVLNCSELRKDLIAKGNNHVAQHSWGRAAERMESVFADILRLQ
jgi:glycosyltransferase involved in cell wall biosynthesis